MLTLLNLFGKSPFAPLQSHMEKVAECVHRLPSIFEAVFSEQWDKVASISKEISKAEYQADLTKNNIRNHLPKSLFLPIDRSNILEILSTQDTIADRAEDVGVMLTYKNLILPEPLIEPFKALLTKNIKVFNEAHLMIKELDELLESSFGGVEAEKVRLMGEKVAEHEHEVDVVQREVIKSLYEVEDQMSFGTFLLWQKILSTVSSLSNESEKLAHLIRRSLEFK